VTLNSALTNIIEPDFGLLDELLAVDVLTLAELADVRREGTVYRRNKALLELFTSQDQCEKFMKALKRTAQQHVVNFIVHNGGQKHRHLLQLFVLSCGIISTSLSIRIASRSLMLLNIHVPHLSVRTCEFWQNG